MAIYLARAVEYRIFKIGYSQTPESRVASISGGFPVEVTLHRVFEDGCRSDERNAHEHLRDFHVRAEWYSDEGLRVAEDLFEDLEDSLAKAGAECAAAIMRQYLPLSEVENFIATLEAAGATSIAAAFTNMTGEAVMDRSAV